MSSLAFLQADADVERGTAPVARSPMAREAAAAGARCVVRDGWEVATSYVGGGAERLACLEAVGFADRSHLGKLELQGAAAALDALDAVPPLPADPATRAQDAWWCRVTPERALVLCDPGTTASLRERLTTALDGHVLDVTASYGAVALVGPLARETFARFCALDLRPHVAPVQSFRPGSIARTPGYVLREDEQRYLMLFGAAYGRYLWTVLADAATRLGGRPIGEDALAPVALRETGSHA